MTDTAGPTTLGGLRSGQDPRVPGLLAELEGMRGQLSIAVGVAQRALGMVEGLAERIGGLEQAIDRRTAQPAAAPQVDEHGDPLPTVVEVAEHAGDLEARLNLLAKVVVSSIPGAADQLRRLSADG